ncbi:flagellar motor switch protein FliN [Helicobacter pullorum]|uniref:flagellar motor switch protein FliY n=1 Tax=Helicobacter pullorum TaxID=35818 RepID=UPI000816ACDF|nr:flagellar motor switch protein FliY [Helicobacter pullorum]OCR03775.1 flagellar motor switch protein FliN [Helicobacter pullorum]OCR08546.1 flagellar motor switch protein FliN [Helicobacter pullorum]OCR08683.1 flagellar motor switch protein FliN [Helicobacter pullorum]OCR10264.1 flagellar motor switch protein FliN [Helicobacter pullorum]
MLNDFLKLITQESIATIEGLLGQTPDISHLEEKNGDKKSIKAPIARIDITTDNDANLALFISPKVATALADMMLGGEGTAKDTMDNDDLDATKEITSNIFGAISTSLGAQKELPKLSFTLKNIQFITEDSELGLENFSGFYTFAFNLGSIQDFLYFAFSSSFENSFNPNTTEDSDNAALDANTQTEAEEEKFELNNAGLKNIAMLLDVRLQVKVRIGQKKMLLKDVIAMDIGSVVELNQLANDPLEVLVDDKVIAKGEVVIVDGNFGIQITEIAPKKDRIEQLM